MNSKPKILFTATFSTPFIQADNTFFRQQYPVELQIRSGVGAIAHFIAALPSYSISFSWFASVYSAFLVLLARLFGKKAVIVLGGVDTAKIPEYQYGLWISPWKSFLVGFGLRNADRILAVDASLKQEAMHLAQYDGGNIEIIPTGYDHTVWTPGGRKDDFVLTIAHCVDRSRGMIKGLDYLAQIARVLPDVRFVLIGVSPLIQSLFDFPKNVKLYEYTPQEQLIEFYRRAKVYLHPSRREGLPNTLCEAMLCECYPIGTETGGIPSAIGTTGSVIHFDDVPGAEQAIRNALTSDRCTAARQRIIDHFPKEKRERALQKVIESLSHG